MLLKNSISNTKKFFQKTLQGFKSFFSGGSYEKLPKSPAFISSLHCNGEDITKHYLQNTSVNTKEFDKFFNDFTDRWEEDKKQQKKRTTKQVKKPERVSTTPNIQETVVDHLNGNGNSAKLFLPSSAFSSPVKSNYINHGGKRTNIKKEHLEAAKLRGERACMVAQKLKELEMMDISNVDHALDVEEVLHYYSRLTCPAYLEIVDKFFMEMYTEFFNGRIGSTPPSVNSRSIRLTNSLR